MSFRHDLMLTGGNHTRLVHLARARGITTDDVLCEALRNYINAPSLFTQSIFMPVDGPNTYINCALPDDLRNDLQRAAERHTVKPMGHQSTQTVFTRAVQHYFNQLAAAPDITTQPGSASIENTALSEPELIDQRQQRLRAGAALTARKFKL